MECTMQSFLHEHQLFKINPKSRRKMMNGSFSLCEKMSCCVLD